MDTLNSKFTHGHLSSISSFHHHRLNFPRPLSSLCFNIPSGQISSSSHETIKASLSRAGNPNKHPQFFSFAVIHPKGSKTIAQNSPFSFLARLETTLVTTITAIALFFFQFYFTQKPAVAATIIFPPNMETATEDVVADEEREKFLEEHVFSNPYDVDLLKDLLEIKISSKKFPEAIDIIEKLIELEPEETKWHLTKAHLYAYVGDNELAEREFDELLKKNPFLVEAYLGLLNVASQEESGKKLGEIEKRVEEAMKLFKKKKKKTDMREFKLLLAQIRVAGHKFDEALKVYQELVKEEPRDFRPYLCQGIIYTLLRKNGDAEKNFEKFRRLVPKGHPYVRYLNDERLANKIFSQKM